MKCFRSVRQFVAAVCREKGQWCPKSTHYLVRDVENVVRVEKSAPRSYRKLKEVMFCVDGDRFVTRRFGVWVEAAHRWDERWLMERQLQEAVDWLQKNRCIYEAPRFVEPEVEQKLNEYLDTARQRLYESYCTGVIEETLRLMEKDGCFSTLRNRGDLLQQAVA